MRSWLLHRGPGITDLIFWVILFFAWYLMRVSDFPQHSVAISVTTVKVLMLALLVYITNLYLIPRFLYQKKYWLFGVLFFLMIVFFGMIKIWLIIKLLQPYYSQRLYLLEDLRTKVYDDLLPLFLLVSTGAAVKLVSGYIISEKRIVEISREKAETELQFLKSQVNPHFVFNTLNSIYFQIDKSNQEARETLIQFSDLLRYQLYECNADRIPVDKELAYLGDYVKLQEKRKDGNYKVNWEKVGELNGFSIAPLLLMPLVENAFKHISHFSEKPNTIFLLTESRNGKFIFNLVNTTEPGTINQERYGGIGLINVKRRLELIYPGKHDLSVTNVNGIFSVQLSLDLHEN